MKRAVKQGITVIWLTILLVSLMSCAKDTQTPKDFGSGDDIIYNGQRYPKMDSGDGVVRILAHTIQGEAMADVLKSVYGLKIQMLCVPYEEIIHKTEQMQAAGERLDLVIVTEGVYPSRIAKGLYLPLDDYIDFGDSIWSGSKKSADKLRYNGKLYMIPKFGVNRFVWYNQVLFKQRNLKTPLEYYQNGEWTWENFELLCKTLQKPVPGVDKVYSIGGSIYGPLLASKNTEYLIPTPEGIRNAVLDDAITDCIEYANDVYKDQRFLAKEGEGLQYFLDQKLAMYYEGHWISSMKEMKQLIQKGDIGFVPIPRWENQEQTIYTAEHTGFLIPKNVKNIGGSLSFLLCNQIYSNSGSYAQVIMKELRKNGLKKEIVDIYGDIHRQEVAFGFPICYVFEDTATAWKPYEWLIYENKRWSFIKMRTYNLFQDELNIFNQKYHVTTFK